jgi:hypothetical protein
LVPDLIGADFGLYLRWWWCAVALHQLSECSLHSARCGMIPGDFSLELAVRKRGIDKRAVYRLHREPATPRACRIDPGPNPHYTRPHRTPPRRPSRCRIEPGAFQVGVAKLDLAYRDSVGP